MTIHRSRPWALVVLSFVAGGCSAPAATEAPPPDDAPSATSTTRGQQVRTIIAEGETFVEQVEVSATVTTRNDVTLSARASGTLVKVVELGSRVEKGEVLASIDAELARSQLAQARAGLKVAQASLKLAEDSYKRRKPLFDQEVISPLEFEQIVAELHQAEANLAQAEAMVTQMREQVRLASVVTPFGGVVEDKFIDQGEQVAPGTPVVRVVDASTVKVKGGVPERYAPDIERGRQATVRFNAYGLAPREGPVTFVSSVIDAASRTFTVEVELDNPDGSLKPEMVARILLDRTQTEGALAVPQTAVLHDNEGDSLFVVNRDGQLTTAERRRVVLGARSRGRVVILDGIQENDEVIVLGHTSLASGDLVEVEPTTSAQLE